LRAAGGLQEDDTLDEQHPGRRAPHLRGGRLPPSPRRTPSKLRPGPGRRDLGKGSRVSRTPAVMAAAATGVQVGATIVATRIVVDQSGPASLALLRYVIGFGCLLPFVLRSGKVPRFVGRDVLPIGLLGITQFGILIALLNYGLRFIPAGRGALIFATFPLLT